MDDARLFLLAFFRLAGVVMAAPLFGSPMVPRTVKVFLSLILAMVLLPVVQKTGVTVEPHAGAYLLAVFGETAVGVMIGFAASLLFAGVQLGGRLIDQEMGLTMAEVFDPLSDVQVSIVGQFKLLLSIVVYLLIDGHHFLIQAASDSFAAVPILGLRFSDGLALHLSDTLVRDLFVAAVKIAAPAMATLFLVTIATAFMARTVPEMNVFALGFALRIGVGLLVLAVGVGLFVQGFQAMNAEHSGAVLKLIDLMRATP